MSYSIWSEQWAIWGIALAVGFPSCVVALGELIQRLSIRQNPLARPLRGVLYLVLPSFVLLLFLTKVIELPAEDMLWKLSATLFWICLINSGLLLIDVLVFEEADTTTWRAHVSSLLRDLSRAFLVIIGASFVLSSIWGADLGKLLSAVGVGSMLIGLALQDTMKNLITGITLLAHRTMKLGDWLQVGSVIGEVVEMNWRCIHLVTHHGELIVIPNIEVGQSNVKNFSRLDSHLEHLDFSFGAGNAPNQVKRVMRDVARKTEGVETDTDPIVRVQEGGKYTITLKITDFSRVEVVRDLYTSLLWYVAKREGIDSSAINLTTDEIVAQFRRIPMLETLDDQLIHDLATGTRSNKYGAGECVIRQGDTGRAMFIVLDESATVVIERNGEKHQVAKLRNDDVFGELALLKRMTTTASVFAESDLDVLEIDPNPIHELLKRSPEFAREFEGHLYSRHSI